MKPNPIRRVGWARRGMMLEGRYGVKRFLDGFQMRFCPCLTGQSQTDGGFQTRARLSRTRTPRNSSLPYTRADTGSRRSSGPIQERRCCGASRRPAPVTAAAGAGGGDGDDRTCPAGRSRGRGAERSDDARASRASAPLRSSCRCNGRRGADAAPGRVPGAPPRQGAERSGATSGGGPGLTGGRGSPGAKAAKPPERGRAPRLSLAGCEGPLPISGGRGPVEAGGGRAPRLP